MTRKQIKDQVIQWLGLQDIDSYNETVMVDDLIYQGTLDLLSRTRCTVRCVQLRVQAGQDEYTLDHGILALVDLENGARRRMRRDEPDYWYDGGAVWYAYDGRDGPPHCHLGFTLLRSDLLLVKPTPSVDGTIQVWGVMRPLAMMLDSDSPGMEAYGAIPDEYHDAIVDYALWKGADYSDDAGSQMGERYRMLYEGQDGRGGRLGQIRVLVNKRGTARAPRRKSSIGMIRPGSVWVG